MKKTKIRINREVLATVGMVGIVSAGIGTMVAISLQEPQEVVVETTQDMNSFDLLASDDMRIITTVDALGKESTNFVCRRSLESLFDSNQREEYEKYFVPGVWASSTYLYFDVFNDELLSVEYIDKENNLFKDDVVDISYKIREVVDSNLAYNYAVLYYGDKDSYSLEEMGELVDKVSNNNEEKTYIKQR